ncbi:MAG: serine/threonine protein kinase [Planctomycetota bacterium]
MSKKSTFGAKPEQLKRLLTAIGLEKSSASEKSDQMASSAPSMGELGDRIGRYKLLSVLGEGGMGIVCLAEQKHPIRRQVALKVIKPGMDSARVIARFETERQALALLDHPNIAHVHDAGTTEAGRPYFAMEYVKGLPITEYCDRHKLTIEDRLKLFLQICHAVHHAHQKGIIHRDIKPSNILVTSQDDQAVPKIIDFGVAKAVNQPLTDRTLFTEQGQLFGTPEYMSPEQADMANEDIDTRSDIYSLGVLLYVLLTGALPFDSETLREGGIEHIRQIIRETDPKTPSTRLSSLGEEAKKVAESRRTEIATLAKKLHKELEWIPLKAMRKERAERYRSASEFADDIENYLNGAPLIAGPPSNVYRLKKLVRRNRALVTGIGAVLAVLIAGIIVSTLFAIKAQREAKVSQTLTDFFQSGAVGGIIGTNDQFVVLNAPDESPGDPLYADIGRDFIPTDGTHVAIVFMRDPAYIPPEYNLLDMRDFPAALECPFLLRGQEWWHETNWLNFLRTRNTSEKPDRHGPFVDRPIKCMYVDDGSVPVYFVDLAELNSEIADDQLTLGELEAFSSLKVGQATYFKNDLLNSNAPDSDGKGHGRMTVIGTLQESGEFFYVHWHEEFDPAIGKNVFRDTVIKFFPGAN